jgi:hypothetical protein
MKSCLHVVVSESLCSSRVGCKSRRSLVGLCATRDLWGTMTGGREGCVIEWGRD